MFGKIAALVTFLSVLAIASTAPRRKSRSPVPSWHIPCGSALEVDSSPIEDWDEEIKNAFARLKIQHEMTMNDYLRRDYEFLYDNVKSGVDLHQYIPNWVPGKKDVRFVKNLKNAKPHTIANHLPKLHSDLQKFAVAFEELVEDETDAKILQALKSTQGYLMEMLCEVESNLVVLPPLQVPPRVKRSIMNDIERNPVDVTRRLIRDWGIIHKYRNYLHAWRHVFQY